ncbi:MAG TPA: DeoR/GlpR transcriptional regulator [Candidatus Pelethocola excrementipullorum]|nr:DeoR/GlpR transcriptional regulator [Candidatus Pelethocola excrementipullorum]
MLKSERLEQIQTMLEEYGKVEVSSLCRIFDVTEMTIRRDLNELEKRKVAIRSHGGAILPPEKILGERPYNSRISSHLKEKEAIAQAALPLLEDGSKYFFDSSTSVYALARLINNTQNFLVVTDTISTALELNSRKNLEVICLGGELQKNTNSCTGVFAEQMLKNMFFDYAFIGLYGVSEDGILYTTSTMEYSLKRLILDHSKKTIVLIDSSKLGPPSFLQIGTISEIDTIITDSNIPQSFVNFCRNAGTNLIIADVI